MYAEKFIACKEAENRKADLDSEANETEKKNLVEKANGNSCKKCGNCQKCKCNN